LADVLKIQGIKIKLLEILPHRREQIDECKNHVWSKLRRCLKEEMQIKSLMIEIVCHNDKIGEK
jgi:hypothetical protein